MKYIILLVMIIYSPLLTSPVTTYAQDNNNIGVTQQIEEIKGELLKVEGQKLSIKTDDKITEYIIPSNIQISRNSLNAEVNDLKPGDSVAMQVANGQILSIGSTSESVTDTAQVAIPIAIGALVLALIAYTLWKKNTKNFIKTDTAKLQ